MKNFEKPAHSKEKSQPMEMACVFYSIASIIITIFNYT